MRDLANAMRAQASGLQNTLSHPRKGTVSGFDPTHYAVKVLIQPEGYETGWIPLGTMWVGAGWGLYCPPGVGDMVEVGFEKGSMDAGAVGVRFFNDTDTPLSVASGEFWLVHKSGSFLKFTNDGLVTINAPAGLNVTGNVSITGTVTATGEGTFNGGHTVSQHTHGALVLSDTATPTG